jgi:hypothetical protein
LKCDAGPASIADFIIADHLSLSGYSLNLGDYFFRDVLRRLLVTREVHR